ncbi:MAG: rod shape-determining protein MreC [Acidobacteriota bacterium]|nr:rod shape-determining protein MreC [Acidobacteriota bacterium]
MTSDSDRVINSKANRERGMWVLLPLLVLHVALLSLEVRDSSGTMLIKSWVLAIQSPMLSASEAVSGGIGGVWRNYVWLVGARRENQALRERTSRLSLLNRAYEQSRLENDRLRRLLAMRDAGGLTLVGADITARTPDFLSNMVYVNRGERDGVRLDAPVLSGDGIVGRVVLVTANQSQVQLLTNPDASIGAMLDGSRTPGVLIGDGNPLLTMRYVSSVQPVEVGELVVSSGLDGIFPKGIVIGTVVSVDKGNDVFKEIKVQPMMDFIHLEEVAILLGGGTPREEIPQAN